MQKCKRGLDAFPSLQICVCVFISWPTLLLSVRFKIDLPSRWLESSTVASRRLQSKVISEVESQALFQGRERRLLRGSWIGGNHHHCRMSCDFEVTNERHAVGKKILALLAISELRRELGRVSDSNQSINWHHHIKGHIEIGFLNKFSALKLNRDQVMTLETWLKIHTNLAILWQRPPKQYRVFSHDVTAAILVSQNNETAAMFVSQTSPVGVELFSYANAFFCSNKFA